MNRFLNLVDDTLESIESADLIPAFAKKLKV